jgi:hypothetical protein
MNLFPLLHQGWRLYPMHAAFCLGSFVLVYLLYPETCGVPLEEMNLLFGDGSFSSSLPSFPVSSFLRFAFPCEPKPCHADMLTSSLSLSLPLPLANRGSRRRRLRL